MSAPRIILVYHPDEADAYAKLIRAPRRSLRLAVCQTPEAAARHVAEAEILYTWGFPPDLLPQARKLRWIQVMGAGIERFLVPGLRDDVVITRARSKLVVLGGRSLFLDVPATHEALAANECFKAFLTYCQDRAALFEMDRVPGSRQ